MNRVGLAAGLAALLIASPVRAEETVAEPPAPAAAAPEAPPTPILSPEEKAKAAAAALAIKPTDIGLGDPKAKVVIVEYASSGCSHCADFTLTDLPQLKTAYIDKGQVYLVLRDFPLDNVAAGASMIARCLPPEKFYGFMETLFSQQSVWHGPTTADPLAELKKIAAGAGLDETQTEACLQNKENLARLNDGVKEAAEVLDINSTPTIFINGVRTTGGHSFLDLAEIINAELAK